MTPDSEPTARAGAAYAVVPALVVVALVGVVAIAAAGSLPTGSGDLRLPPESLIDTTLTFFLIAAIPALIIYVYGLLYAEMNWWPVPMPAGGIRAFIVFMLLVAAIIYLRFSRPYARSGPGQIDEGALPEQGSGSNTGETGPQATYEPEFALVSALVVLALAVIAFALMVMSESRRRPAGVRHESETIAEALAALLGDTLDDLRAEKDPRRAVIAAYARLERILALHGLERHPSEAPGEYLGRILPVLDVEPGSVRRLSDLFTWAKFSDHDVDRGMKQEAIEALSTVRDELRVAGEHTRAERLAPLKPAVGGS